MKVAESTNIPDKELLALAKKYYEGKEVPKDEGSSLELLEILIERNCEEAFEYYVKILQKKNTDQSLSKSISLMLKFAEADNVVAWGYLGRAYFSGKGVTKDLQKAAEWMRKAAEAGLQWSHWELFDILWKMDTPESLKEMIERAEPLAEAGNDEMQGRLGRAYRDGKGVGKDLDRAALEFDRAVQSNSNKWVSELFEVLWKINTDSSYAQAVTVAENAMSNGSVNAIVCLEKAYGYGKGVEKDLKKSQEYMELAEKKGNDDARYVYWQILWDSKEFDKILSDAKSLKYTQSLSKLLVRNIYNFNAEDVKYLKNIFDAIQFETSSKEYVMVLLKSNLKEDHESALKICKGIAMDSDGWFRETLGLMYYHGMGTKINRDIAIDILNHCDNYRRFFPIPPYEWFNDELYDFKRVYIYGSRDEVEELSILCLQNHLRVAGVIGCEDEFPTLWEKTEFADLSNLENIAIVAITKPPIFLPNAKLFLSDSELYVKNPTLPDDLIWAHQSVQKKQLEIQCNTDCIIIEYSEIPSFISTHK